MVLLDQSLELEMEKNQLHLENVEKLNSESIKGRKQLSQFK